MLSLEKNLISIMRLKIFHGLKVYELKNEITEVVSRYMWLKVENVANIESPDYINKFWLVVI